jgi:hypothetical protein
MHTFGKCWRLSLAFVVGATGAQAAVAGPSVLFMADPQIHNVYGGEVKQTLGLADWYAGVARRHPEMNLLSRYAIQDFVKRGEEMGKPGDPPFMVVLGDATNAACTGEYERFMGAVKAGNPDRLVLMAHGNHDSYLMGTINYWQAVVSEISDADLRKFDGPYPVDVSWWPQGALREGRGREGWRALCTQTQAGPGVPMHKIQWMAKYLESLAAPAEDGRRALTLNTGPVSGKEVEFSSTVTAGTALGALDYQARGVWTRPDRSGRGLADTYDSFLVQAVDVGDSHRLILVDTAACAWFNRPWYKRWPRFVHQNAGTAACLHERQLGQIRILVGHTPGKNGEKSGRKIVFAGHHPLKDIQDGEREAFVELMEAASGKDWTYISAHTHRDLTITPQRGGAREININSTTDWPMSAFRIGFDKSVSATRIPGPEPTVFYQPPAMYPRGPELCRHLDAARKLRDLDTEDPDYASPGSLESYKKCTGGVKTKWDEYEKELHDAEQEIARRMGKDEYRRRALGIMAAASQHENATFWLDKYSQVP